MTTILAAAGANAAGAHALVAVVAVVAALGVALAGGVRR